MFRRRNCLLCNQPIDETKGVIVGTAGVAGSLDVQASIWMASFWAAGA